MVKNLANHPSGSNAAEPDSHNVPTSAENREPWWRRLTNMIWGYDFFVSYNWASGGQYAVGLAEKLRERGYDCFLDQSEFAAGDDWKSEARKALRNTRRLVIIATRQAVVDSEAVHHEIEVFTRRSRRVIPIVFGERFSEDEQHNLPTLKQIPDSTIDLVEDLNRLDKGPSENILTKLIQTNRLVRRRSVRALIVTAALTILATAAVVASIFWVRAEIAKSEEFRQRLLAQSAELINKSDLWRETKGPKLEESWKYARKAYDNAKLAEETSDNALRAMRQAAELIPESIGEPWLPFGTPVSFRLRAIKNRLVLLREDSPKNNEPFALIAELDRETQQWRIVQRFTNETHGRLAADQYGREIVTPDNPRWLLTCREAQVIIWDIIKDDQAIRLPIAHEPSKGEGQELLAINMDADHAIVRNGHELTIWNIAGPSPKVTTLPMEYSPARYAISPSGKKLAWAYNSEFVVFDVKDGKNVLHYQIKGGGNNESLKFIGRSKDKNDMAVFAAWSENQVMAMAPIASENAPNFQAGIWLGKNALDTKREGENQTPPDMKQVRANAFNIVFNTESDQPSLAILDPENVVQWLDIYSQLSFTLGGAAGPGTRARFNAQNILIVHTDGTARLWDLDTRQETLRYTSEKASIVDAVFLNTISENRKQARGVVTLDKMGYLQGWTCNQDPDHIKTLASGKGEKDN